MATARKAPVRRATPLAARPAAKRSPTAKADAARAMPNGAMNGHAKPARAKGADAAQPEVAMAAADPARKSRASDPAADAADGIVRPAYWDKACADLVKRDRILKKLIPKFGPAHLVKRGDPFVTLARSVVGQQISVPSAQALWARIEDACPKLAPQPVIRLGADKLIGCGLSKRKTEYILDLAQHFVSGALHVDKWTSMDDEDVIAELTQIRGISRWTAEMFLIFNLSRPDVLPLDDPGLIRAISVNYFSGEPVTRSEAREVAANWEPWRTVATWYMWRSLDVPDTDAD
ncbi:DNA-3-methyladenine glycosylase 2 family protein [Burkholderia sp. AU19243]|uniref:DNA-3-methyladenine glycosylase II n=1 Tax=Burkholderia latens TaxID=488446 RepID=A0AAP1C525_9BURK|nr:MULTISPECIES: DNA-3-methyladenine glycosylase [Burkholderia]AIO41870.1 hhH-GPD superbase excision DNA repair family protein [Burkholderia cenocepacia]MBR7958991.1 DNA-3-methyladenine glycosylase 2 family protein [Burkholderia vietnamiensis]AOK04769.1 DNA-3-methyladenine glycosylase [Burkholderia latens]KVA06240.1 DNA-3-methyladenine glycosylase [Burkholderia latens]MBR8141972.1 DNA-3-methyladenine glycosylase 2 family protein [Burkholderia vietnamiensis]